VLSEHGLTALLYDNLPPCCLWTNLQGFSENFKRSGRWNYAQIRGIKSCFEKGCDDMNEDYGTGI